MTKLKCTGDDGVEREFACRVREESFFGTIHFYVRPIDQYPQDEFELVLKEEATGFLRVKMMNHQQQECYSRKGIPEAILLHAAETLQKPIKSSPGYSPDGQWRIPAATKVWQRLCQAGQAKYDSDTDTFSTLV